MYIYMLIDVNFQTLKTAAYNFLQLYINLEISRLVLGQLFDIRENLGCKVAI